MNLREQLDAHLNQLKLHSIASNLDTALAEAKEERLSTLEVLCRLMADEVCYQEQRALERRIVRARLPKEKGLLDYDFNFPKRIAKQKILNYFDCTFVENAANLILIGNQGVGKTHLLTALGYKACRLGISTRFVRTVDMINHLVASHCDGSLGKAMRAYTRPQLLLLDELGYLPIDKRGADLMFQVVAARYETGSIVITTNRLFKDWGAIFDVDPHLASAMIDRLMHHGDAVIIKGDSYRMKDRK